MQGIEDGRAVLAGNPEKSGVATDNGPPPNGVKVAFYTSLTMDMYVDLRKTLVALLVVNQMNSLWLKSYQLLEGQVNLRCQVSIFGAHL